MAGEALCGDAGGMSMTTATSHDPPATAPDTDAAVAAAIELIDEAGVVSAYVPAPPRADAIERLLDETSPTPPDDLPALERSIAAMERRAAASSDGRARALFAGVGSGRTLEVALPVSVEPYASLDRLGHVRPLVDALDRARPAGLVVLNGARLSLHEITGPTLTELGAFDLAAAEDERRRRRGGPGAPNGTARQPGNWRDRHARLRRHHADRLAAGFADQVEAVARLREWDVVVSTGNRRLMAAFARRFAGRQAELVELGPAVSRLSRRSLAEQAHDRATAFRRERTLAMAADIVESPATIWGVTAALDALDGGRVDHVLIADDLPAESAERLIRRALDSGAQLTLLDAGALGPLGVAAGPRW
jgi:Bacterial archaeo-eukaryotic release factor family 10